MSIPKGLRYTTEHEWVKEEGKSATFGITDFAQSELGDLVYVELPAIGKTVKKGDVFAVVESVKAASDVYAPISGTVTEVNEALNDSPGSVNTDPYGAGWIAKVQPSDLGELEKLFDSAGYEAHLSGKK